MTTVNIETNHGNISFELLPELAPETVRNFEKLTKDGFYDGTLFHRVIPGFMIQGGDPNTKTDNKGAGSQFFIVTSDSAFLDREYTVFGQVKEGMDVADKIVNEQRDGNDCPLEKVEMTKVTLE